MNRIVFCRCIGQKPFSNEYGFFITRKRRRTVNRNVSAHSATLRVSEACWSDSVSVLPVRRAVMIGGALIRDSGAESPCWRHNFSGETAAFIHAVASTIHYVALLRESVVKTPCRWRSHSDLCDLPLLRLLAELNASSMRFFSSSSFGSFYFDLSENLWCRIISHTKATAGILRLFSAISTNHSLSKCT